MPPAAVQGPCRGDGVLSQAGVKSARTATVVGIVGQVSLAAPRVAAAGHNASNSQGIESI